MLAEPRRRTAEWSLLHALHAWLKSDSWMQRHVAPVVVQPLRLVRWTDLAVVEEEEDPSWVLYVPSSVVSEPLSRDTPLVLLLECWRQARALAAALDRRGVIYHGWRLSDGVHVRTDGNDVWLPLADAWSRGGDMDDRDANQRAVATAFGQWMMERPLSLAQRAWVREHYSW